MAHKTMVNGTAYEITGGKTLVNGTAYSIKNGKTLVGGTAYEVGFAKPVTIKIAAGVSDSQYASVEHNGVTYSAATTFTANIGDVIRCTVGACYGGMASVSVNNTSVMSETVSGNDLTQFTYEYEVVSNAVINMYYYTTMGKYSGLIAITAVPEGFVRLTVSGYLDSSYAYWTLDGVDRTDTGTFEIAQTSTLNILAGHPAYADESTITLNGTRVAKAAGGTDGKAKYSLALDGLTTATLSFTRKKASSSGNYSYSCTIITI